MSYQWSPDYTSVIDTSQYPGAQWNPEAKSWDYQYSAPIDPNAWWVQKWPELYGPGGSQVAPPETRSALGLIEQARDDYSNKYQGDSAHNPGSAADILKAAGLWNLGDQNSDTYKYLSAVGGGDVRNDPQAMFRALSNSYQADGTSSGVQSAWDSAYGDLIAAGINPQYAESMRTAGMQHFDAVKDAPWDYAGMMMPLAFASGGILAPYLGGGLLGAAGAGAATGGLGSALTGENILEGALKGGLTGAAGAGLGELASGLGGLSDVDMGLAVDPFTTDPSLSDLGGNIDAATGLPAMADPLAGLTPQDLGLAVDPFTTNPSLQDLGGNIDAATGLPAPQTLEQLAQSVQASPPEPSASTGSTLEQLANSVLGPQTGTTLDAGVQPSGAVTTPITTQPPQVSAVAEGAGPFVPTPGTAPVVPPVQTAAAPEAPAPTMPAAEVAPTPAAATPPAAAMPPAVPEVPQPAAPAPATTQMPAAVAETPQALGEQNLTQTGTGQFEQINPTSITNPLPAVPAAAAALTPAEKIAKIIRGEGSMEDFASVLGAAGPSILGAIGANQQTNAYKELSEKYMAMGAPSRTRYEGSFAPGFSMNSDPGFQDALDSSANATLRKMSATGGNPFGNPTAWGATMNDVYKNVAYPALQQYRNQNASTGGYGAFNSAAPGAATGAVNAGKGVYDAIGAGAADIFNPPRTLEDIYRGLRMGGLV